MKVYVFGNEDLGIDNRAFEVVKEVNDNNPDIDFVTVRPNADLPFTDGTNLIIMDVIENLKELKLIQGNVIDDVTLPPRTTSHDFDLGLQLKYLKKLGKLGKVTIIGLPVTGKVNYRLVQSILRKLVAQDMQGS